MLRGITLADCLDLAAFLFAAGGWILVVALVEHLSHA